MVCKKAPGRVARYQVLNDIILLAINAADVPAVKSHFVLEDLTSLHNNPEQQKSTREHPYLTASP